MLQPWKSNGLEYRFYCAPHIMPSTVLLLAPGTIVLHAQALAPFRCLYCSSIVVPYTVAPVDTPLCILKMPGPMFFHIESPVPSSCDVSHQLRLLAWYPPCSKECAYVAAGGKTNKRRQTTGKDKEERDEAPRSVSCRPIDAPPCLFFIRQRGSHVSPSYLSL